jgi:hypothetical protein
MNEPYGQHQWRSAGRESPRSASPGLLEGRFPERHGLGRGLREPFSTDRLLSGRDRPVRPVRPLSAGLVVDVQRLPWRLR